MLSADPPTPGRSLFRIGTAITLQGGPSRYPVNGYQSGLLTASPQDRAYQALV